MSIAYKHWNQLEWKKWQIKATAPNEKGVNTTECIYYYNYNNKIKHKRQKTIS